MSDECGDCHTFPPESMNQSKCCVFVAVAVVVFSTVDSAVSIFTVFLSTIWQK